MFEATVRDSPDELVLEKEVAETGGVDADIAALLVACRIGRSQAAFRRARVAVGGGLSGLNLLVRVVDEILLVRHGSREEWNVWDNVVWLLPLLAEGGCRV